MDIKGPKTLRELPSEPLRASKQATSESTCIDRHVFSSASNRSGSNELEPRFCSGCFPTAELQISLSLTRLPSSSATLSSISKVPLHVRPEASGSRSRFLTFLHASLTSLFLSQCFSAPSGHLGEGAMRGFIGPVHRAFRFQLKNQLADRTSALGQL